jgi:hypothetical protein
MRQLGIPFWLAGGYAHPAELREALTEGACGVQVGTAFALCEESGLDPGLKRRAREQAATGRLVVRTDPVASPTGYPFKIAQLAGTMSDPRIRAARRRRCDLSYLTTPYRQPDGTLGYRCPGEPALDYVAKGGDASDTVGRMCLCNGLAAAVGLAQHRRGASAEPPLLTLGDDACAVLAALSPDGRSYRAEEVVRHLLGPPPPGVSAERTATRCGHPEVEERPTLTEAAPKASSARLGSLTVLTILSPAVIVRVPLSGRLSTFVFGNVLKLVVLPVQGSAATSIGGRVSMPFGSPFRYRSNHANE